ncbi:MAG TPA: cytochrome c [Burkholderiales bacterium]|nr:cytochrome c [Burkholderiales bacterium]
MKKIQAVSGGARARVFAVAALSLWALSASTFAETTDEDRPVIKVPRGGGRELFSTNCVLCHKYDGRGGPSEGGYGADLRVTKLTEDEVRQVITNGRLNKGMPPFKGILDEEMIETLARFVKNDLKLNQ